MSAPGKLSRLRVTTWILALAPLLSPVLLYSFAVRARLALGRWPSFSNPDPKELGFDLHRSAWFLGMSLEFAVAPVLFAIVLIAWPRFPHRRREMIVAAFVYCGLLLSTIVLFWSDPGGFSEWMMD